MSTESTKEQTTYYPSKDVCNKFDISSSTLRKWCLALEEGGYEFARTEQNRRLFVDGDLEALESLRELIQNKGMSLKNASTIVTSRFKGVRSSSGTPSVPETQNNSKTPSNEKMFDTLLEHIEIQNNYIENQEQFNQELLNRLDKQQSYMNEKIEQRDRQLMEAMNRMTEERKKEIKLLQEAKEEKKGWLAKLLGQ